MSLTLLQGKQQVRVPRTFAEIKLRIGVHTGIQSLLESSLTSFNSYPIRFFTVRTI